jgi:hypothetical protein
MAKYLITYHGGEGMPSTPEGVQEMLAAFQSWVSSVGGAVIDPGAPLSLAKTVSAKSVVEGQTAGQLSGYTIIEADDLGEAVNLVQPHPFLTRGGTLQVSEAVNLGAQ